jgi:hypothetical protein
LQSRPDRAGSAALALQSPPGFIRQQEETEHEAFQARASRRRHRRLGCRPCRAQVALEAPEANSIQSGITQIYGWASDVEPVVKVELYIDGNEAQTMVLGSGGERADVATAYPNDYDPLHSGFATAFHTKLLSNGPHTITIEAKNQSGEETKVTSTIIVSNTPDATVLTDTIDLSGATARISGNHIFLDGVVVNGTTYNNFELRFDDVINGFRIIGFNDDLDGDGFLRRRPRPGRLRRR